MPPQAADDELAVVGTQRGMQLPLDTSLRPMLARLARELPEGDYLYEPKWDGFRCLVYSSPDAIDLRSRHGRPFARYFPELVSAFEGLPERRSVIDGEIVVTSSDRFDFAALMARLHPAASRVERLARDTPASFIAFDLLFAGEDDLRGRGFAERRARLEQLLAGARSPLFLTPITDDAGAARAWLERFSGGGLDGVVAKHRDLAYEPGRRSMVKVKRERTADCVVGGFRVLQDESLLGSLILGLYQGDALIHVGVASSFSSARRRELLDEVRPLIVPLEGHPWEQGFGITRSPIGRLGGAAGRWTPELERDWVPLEPVLVAEVAYDHWEGDRFRHPARFVRWRSDREAGSCTFEQMNEPEPPEGPPIGVGQALSARP